MLNIFYFLLVLRVGRCIDKQSIETMTVRIGEDFNLTCIRESMGTLLWIRVVSGMFPEVLGRTNSLETFERRFTVRKEPGTFVLRVTDAKPTDTAVYYCMKMHLQNLTFLKGTDLKVQGTGDISSVPTFPAHPEHSVHLQCSVLSDTVNKKCPEEMCMGCFRDGSRSFNYTRGDGVHEYEENPEKLSTVKCSYLKNISSSDAGACCCALVTCGERFSGNGSKLNTEAVKTWNLQKDKVVIFLLCAALAICLVFIAILILSIKNIRKKPHASVALQTNAMATDYLEGLPTDEDSLVYSTANFRKNSKARARDPQTAEEESIYSDVKCQMSDVHYV